jgi:hypothetical protein
MIHKLYEVDPMVCPRCGGPMKVIAFLTDYAVVDRIINHLKLRHAPQQPLQKTGPIWYKDNGWSGRGGCSFFSYREERGGKSELQRAGWSLTATPGDRWKVPQKTHRRFLYLLRAGLRVQNGTAWDIQTVDLGRYTSYECSIALDSADRPHISYYDGYNKDLNYATVGAGYSMSSGSWTGAGCGADGWYIGDFDGDGGDDNFRYLAGTSGADVLLRTWAAESAAAGMESLGSAELDADMVLDLYGVRQTELSFQEEIALLTPSGS